MLLLGKKFSAHEALKANLLNDVFSEKEDAFVEKVMNVWLSFVQVNVNYLNLNMFVGFIRCLSLRDNWLHILLKLCNCQSEYLYPTLLFLGHFVLRCFLNS